MSSLESKTEASMPVQSRVDLRTLAKLSNYWDGQGLAIGSMSKLVSWSIEALHTVLVNNGVIPAGQLTLEQSLDVLMSRGLMQRSMQNRMEQKYHKARGLENIRMEGSEVDRNSMHYKDLHKGSAVQPLPEDHGRMSDEEYKRQTGMTREEVNELIDKRHKVKVYDHKNQPKIDLNSLLNKENDEMEEARKEKVRKVDDAIANMPDLPDGKGLVRDESDNE